MKNILWVLTIIVLNTGIGVSQDQPFYLQLSSDTILAGNVVQLSFIADNISGKFEGPDLKDLNVISGPNTSTSMSIVNGEISQYGSYGYTILLEEIGDVIIPPAYFDTSDGTFETEPTRIIVLPNPEGIIEQSPAESGMYQFSFPNMPNNTRKNKKEKESKKKKRKLRKI